MAAASAYFGYPSLCYPTAITGFRLCIALESFSGKYHLHFLDLSIADSGSLVHAKLNSLSQRYNSSWIVALRRRISRPIIHQGKVRRMNSQSFLPIALESYPRDIDIPVVVLQQKPDRFLTQVIADAAFFPSAAEILSTYSSYTIQDGDYLLLPLRNALIVQYKTTAKGYLMLTAIFLSFLISVLSGIYTHRADVGIGVAGALFAVVGVVYKAS